MNQEVEGINGLFGSGTRFMLFSFVLMISISVFAVWTSISVCSYVLYEALPGVSIEAHIEDVSFQGRKV